MISGSEWEPSALQDRVQTLLDEHLDDQAARLEELGPDAARLVDAARDAVRGGKRFRAMFCYWGFRAVRSPVDEAEETAVLAPVIVTGSRLAAAGFESTSPVAVVPGAELAGRGAISVGQALAELPQFVPTTGSASNSPGNDGQANLSLRGIGPAQTLVLHGEDDGIVPVENARRLASRIQHARLKVYEGARHVFFIERAAEFNEDVIAFLTNKV